MAKYKWGLERLFFVFVLAFVTTWLTLNLFSVGAKESKVGRIIDGDTLELKSGERVRLLGVDAPDNGEEGFEKSQALLEEMMRDSKVWIEGDRYEEDQYGRLLGWIWIDCESEPQFKPDDYMENVYLKNRGNTYVRWVEENPVGCKGGVLVNEQLLKMGLVSPYFVDGDGELKYEERLRQVDVTK